MKTAKRIANFIAALSLYALFFYYVKYKSLESGTSYEPYIQYRKVIFNGWVTTIAISVLALLAALIVGLILYWMSTSRFGIVRNLQEIHKMIVFGTPLVVIAIVAYYYIGNAFGVRSKFWVGVITLALYIGAYIADIYKGAVESIHINQWQTAKMFGFTKFQTYRYVVFPQVMISILPPLAGQFALTIKGSALLSYMSTDEFLNTIKTVQAASYEYSEGFVIVAAGYLLLTVPLILLVRYLEQKVNYKSGTNI